MPITDLYAWWDRWSHRGSGYSTGPTETRDHEIAEAYITLQVGLSQVQATTDGPLGAAVGIVSFGEDDYGADPANWPAFCYGLVGNFTIAFQVTKGDMTAWHYYNVWQ